MCKQYLPGGTGSVGGINVGDPLDLFGGQKRRDAAAAQRSAEATEAARQGRITTNVKNINSAFDNRQGQYDALGAALRKQYGDYLAQQRGTAEKQTRFGIARAGLTGGSAAIDANRTLQREGDEAVLTAERAARKGVADLQGADEATRTQLISLAQSGNDIGNASANAASALRANLAGAQTAGNVQGLGELFGDTAKAWKASQDAAARRRGLKESAENVYASSFSRG